MVPYNHQHITGHCIPIPGYYASLRKKPSIFMHDKFINDSYFIWSYKSDTIPNTSRYKKEI